MAPQLFSQTTCAIPANPQRSSPLHTVGGLQVCASIILVIDAKADEKAKENGSRYSHNGWACTANGFAADSILQSRSV